MPLLDSLKPKAKPEEKKSFDLVPKEKQERKKIESLPGKTGTGTTLGVKAVTPEKGPAMTEILKPAPVSKKRKVGFEAAQGLVQGLFHLVGGVQKAGAPGEEFELQKVQKLINEGKHDEADAELQYLEDRALKSKRTNPITGRLSPVLESDEFYPPSQSEEILRTITRGFFELVPTSYISAKTGISAGASAIGKQLGGKVAPKLGADAARQAAESGLFTLVRSKDAEELKQNAINDAVMFFPNLLIGKGLDVSMKLMKQGGKALTDMVYEGYKRGIDINEARVKAFLSGTPDSEMQAIFSALPQDSRFFLLRSQLGENRMLALKGTSSKTPLGERRLAGLKGPEQQPELPLPKTDLRSPLQEHQQALSKRKEGVIGESLEEIVEKRQTPVKEKVHSFDYLRTPSKVLQKIGLGDEAKLLRKKHDDYLDELPTQLDKITKWSKQVGPESNERIFRYLDGEDIEITEHEHGIAEEIRSYFSDWADRLGLPPDKRITNYITHIFPEAQIGKEFPEEIANLIQDDVAGSVWNPFLMKRGGKLEYKKDTWAALEAYAKRATRKVHMDEALERVQHAASTLEKSQFDYVKNYVDRINMRPTNADNNMDNFIKSMVGYRLGTRPTLTTTRAARQMIYRGSLGLNMSSALRNLTQGVNTYAKLGEKNTVLGYTKALKAIMTGDTELKDVGVLRENFIQDRTMKATKKFWEKTDKVLFSLFEGAEKINRGAAYFGAKAKYLEQGMPEKQAIEAAKQLVRDTQFSFDKIDMPVGLQSDIWKTLTQFQSYTIKQGEFLVDMAKQKEIAGLVRYVAGSAALYMAVSDMLGMEPKDFVPGIKLLDDGYLPPIARPLKAGYDAVTDAPDRYGNKKGGSVLDRITGSKDVKSAASMLIPGGVQAKKTYEGIKSVLDGEVRSQSGKTQNFKVDNDPLNLLRGAVFGKYGTRNGRRYVKEEILKIPAKKEEPAKRERKERPKRERKERTKR